MNVYQIFSYMQSAYTCIKLRYESERIKRGEGRKEVERKNYFICLNNKAIDWKRLLYVICPLYLRNLVPQKLTIIISKPLNCAFFRWLQNFVRLKFVLYTLPLKMELCNDCYINSHTLSFPLSLYTASNKGTRPFQEGKQTATKGTGGSAPPSHRSS